MCFVCHLQTLPTVPDCPFPQTASGAAPASQPIDLDALALDFLSPEQMAGAIDLTDPVLLAGSIENFGENDLFKVNVTAGHVYEFWLRSDEGSASPLGDPYMGVYDTTGQLIDRADDSLEGVNSYSRFEALEDGVIYLSAEGLGGFFTGDYEVSYVDEGEFDPLSALRGSPIDPGTDRELTYYFADAGYVESSTGLVASADWTEASKASAAAGFDYYSTVLDLSFSQASDAASADVVLFFAQTQSWQGQTGTAYYGVNSYIALSDLLLSGTEPDLVPGGAGYQTFLHEVGHMLGLGHPHDTGFGSEVYLGVDPIDPQSSGYGGLNATVSTIMSYNPIFTIEETEVSHGWTIETLGAWDIEVLQDWYGANLSTGAGDDVYTVDVTGLDDRSHETIYDVGGTDTIVVLGGYDAVIDLRSARLDLSELSAGGLSTGLGSATSSLSIAHGTLIENATGGSGDDVLYGNEASNVLDGGAGMDMVGFGASVEGLVVNFTTGVIVDGGSDTDTLLNIEGARGSDNADRLYGDGGDNIFWGQGGDDLISGYGGSDDLRGGLGIDRLYGGDDADTLYGDEGADLLVGGDGNDWLYGGADADRLYTSEGNDFAYGGEGNDRAWGELGDDYLYGEGGNDTLWGDEGADRLYGGDDADTLDGGEGDDFLFGEAGDDALTGGIGADYLDGGEGADLLDSGDGADRLFGRSGDDVLSAGLGADTLYGHEGDDRLDGGAGNDRLYGGDGADAFVFAVDSGLDTIYDFEQGSDQVDVSALGYLGFEEIEASIFAYGSTGVRIAFSGDDYVIVRNSALEEWDAADFVFA